MASRRMSVHPAKRSAFIAPKTLRGSNNNLAGGPGGVSSLLDQWNQVNVDKAQLAMAEEFGYQGILTLARHKTPQVRNAAGNALAKLQRVDGGIGLTSADDIGQLTRVFHAAADEDVQSLLFWDFATMASVPSARAALADRVGLDKALHMLDQKGKSTLDAAAATFLGNMCADPVYAEMIIKMDGIEEIMRYAKRAADSSDVQDKTGVAFMFANLSQSTQHATAIYDAGGAAWLFKNFTDGKHEDLQSTTAAGISALASHVSLHDRLLADGALEKLHRVAVGTTNDTTLQHCAAAIAQLTAAPSVGAEWVEKHDGGISLCKMADNSNSMTAASTGVMKKLTPAALAAQVELAHALHNVANVPGQKDVFNNNKELIRVVRTLERSDDARVADAASQLLQFLGLTLMRKIAEADMRAREAADAESRETQQKLDKLTQQEKLEAERARVEEEKKKYEDERRQLQMNLALKQNELELRRQDEGARREQEEQERAAAEAADKLRLEQERVKAEQERLRREAELAAARDVNRAKFEQERLRLEKERDELEQLRKDREAAARREKDEAKLREEERRRFEEERIKREEQEKKRHEEEERRRKEEQDLARMADEERKREEIIRKAAEAEILLRGEDLTPDALDRAALEARMREERERALKLQQFESQLEAQRKEDDLNRARLEKERERMEQERAEMEQLRRQLQEAQQLRDREQQVDPRVLELCVNHSLERYLPCFAKLDFADFLKSSDDTLKAAGLQAAGPRRKLLALLAEKRAALEEHDSIDAAFRALLRDAKHTRDPARQIAALTRLLEHSERSSKRRSHLLKLQAVELCISLMSTTRVAEVQSGAIRLLSSLLREPHAVKFLHSQGGIEPLVYLCNLRAFLNDTPTLAAILNCLRRAMIGSDENKIVIRELDVGPSLLDIGCTDIPRCPRIALELLSVLSLENAPVQSSIIRTVVGIARLIQFVDHPDLQIREAVLRCIGSICSGNHRDAQYTVFSKPAAMESIVRCMGAENPSDLRAAGAFAVGFIAEGEAEIQKALIERGAIRQLVRLLPSNNHRVQRAVCIAIRALSRGRTQKSMQDFMYRVLALGPVCQLSYSRRVGVKLEAIAALAVLAEGNPKNQELIFNSIGTSAIIDGIKSDHVPLQYWSTALMWRLTATNAERRQEFARTNASPLIERLAFSTNADLRSGAKFASSFLRGQAPFSLPVSLGGVGSAEDEMWADNLVFADD